MERVPVTRSSFVWNKPSNLADALAIFTLLRLIEPRSGVCTISGQTEDHRYMIYENALDTDFTD
jgi:hypothetical protein